MNDVANTNKGEYELIENNLLAFNLFKSEEDKKTTDIFAISSPFEYALPQLIDNNTSLNLANIIDINGEPLFNFVDRHLNPKPKVYDKKNDNFYELDFASLSEKTKRKRQSQTTSTKPHTIASIHRLIRTMYYLIMHNKLYDYTLARSH